jgi:hypothetical protein
LEDILEKTRYKIKSERENFQGNSRRKRPASVKSDPVSDVFEVYPSYFFNLTRMLYFLTTVLMSGDHNFRSLRCPIYQTI